MDDSVTPRPCSIAAALSFLGEKWSLLVLREGLEAILVLAPLAKGAAPANASTAANNTALNRTFIARPFPSASRWTPWYGSPGV